MRILEKDLHLIILGTIHPSVQIRDRYWWVQKKSIECILTGKHVKTMEGERE